jgi:xanthine dehydrogenase accessory factor
LTVALIAIAYPRCLGAVFCGLHAFVLNENGLTCSMKTGAADHARILAKAREWAGLPMALATVIETWRSAPCPIGTHMLVTGEGQFVGSVSGGCVEGDVLQTAAEVMGGAPAIVRRYGVADGAAWEVGLPCGGNVAVLVQPVGDRGFPQALFARINAANADGETLMVGTDLESGQSDVVAQRSADQFLNVYAPPKRLLIVGAVEIAAALSSIAQQVGFAVTIIDPRARFLTAERFPGVARDDRWPDEAVTALKPDRRTAVVTLSHDVKIDDPALAAALGSHAAYIAALGSKASHAARLARLTDAGVAVDQLTRIEGPAGVAINAISAPEIALSIAAGMVKVMNDGLR